ncbi:MAG: hypothetical protein ABI585_06485 [Betaproteobacteria bacterium]
MALTLAASLVPGLAIAQADNTNALLASDRVSSSTQAWTSHASTPSGVDENATASRSRGWLVRSFVEDEKRRGVVTRPPDRHAEGLTANELAILYDAGGD